uniref:Carboxylic ester hydrolase n=1 Tax=Panagrolaimus sp. JU765 TaxID=591449 RepID=A0AC34R3V5_9BILA
MRWLLILVAVLSATNAAVVETPFGKVSGFEHETPSGKVADIFLGIPYAEAPIDELRFEKPVPIKPWPSVLNTTQFPRPCAVHDPIFAADASEDCLYLNVYRPKTKSAFPKGYPILVWIHGGGWMMGSSEYYGYKAVTDNFIPHGIMVVSIQYRLGPWGFFSSGDSRMPGNNGLWDQVQALKFINRIAKSFGGDAKRVTLMGQSAGSASVSWLSLNAETDNLFQQTIELSGSVYAAWTRSNEVVDFSFDLAKRLGCKPKSPSLKNCLKKFTMADIQERTAGIGLFKQDTNFAFMNPRIDGKFIRGINFDDSLKKAPKRPTLIGVTSQDSLFWSYEQLGLMPADEIYNLPEDEVQTYSRQKMIQFIRRNVATKERFGARSEEAINDIVTHYADNDAPEEPDNLFYFERFTQMLSDLHFNLPAVREARLKSIAGYPVFFQMYSYEKPLEVTEYPIHGTPHGAEIDPLFKTFVYAGFGEDENDEKIRKTFVGFLASFVQTGNPSTKQTRVLPVTNSTFPYVDIDLQPKIKSNPFGDHYVFWEKMARKYGFDVSKGINLRAPLSYTYEPKPQTSPFLRLSQ